jgi:aryl-alcohol dehydrogenase-like predicted oxidoreductase
VETRPFGKTGMAVTTLGYGAMGLRHVDADHLADNVAAVEAGPLPADVAAEGCFAYGSA